MHGLRSPGSGYLGWEVTGRGFKKSFRVLVIFCFCVSVLVLWVCSVCENSFKLYTSDFCIFLLIRYVSTKMF